MARERVFVFAITQRKDATETSEAGAVADGCLHYLFALVYTRTDIYREKVRRRVDCTSLSMHYGTLAAT